MLWHKGIHVTRYKAFVKPTNHIYNIIYSSISPYLSHRMAICPCRMPLLLAGPFAWNVHPSAPRLPWLTTNCCVWFLVNRSPFGDRKDIAKHPGKFLCFGSIFPFLATDQLESSEQHPNQNLNGCGPSSLGRTSSDRFHLAACNCERQVLTIRHATTMLDLSWFWKCHTYHTSRTNRC